MKLKELVKLNHDCSSMYIRESDGNLSRPVAIKNLTHGLSDEVLEREVKHFQAGTTVIDGETRGCLLITLYM